MSIFSIFKKSDILYFPGCVTYFKHKESYEIYKKIFSKLGIGVIELDDKICCGLPALEAGYEQEVRRLARKNFELFKEIGVKKIITNCPACFKMFSQNYPELLPDWDIKVENVWKLILKKLAGKSRLIKKKTEEAVGYHDSCYLGKYCGIYDEPRQVLELIGYEIEEFLDSRENSFCCGSCGGLARINPELADKIAKQRILQAKRRKMKKIVVASFMDYDLLKKNSDGTGVEILEFSEILSSALNIKNREKKEEDKEPAEEEQLILDIKADEKIKEELKDEPEDFGDL